MEPEKTPRERAEYLIGLLAPDWRPTPEQVLWAIRIVFVLGVLVTIGYAYGITLWEWAKLLIVPAAIAGAGLWFNQQQRVRELQVADQRAQTDREIADQRRQDETLQAYLDGIAQLLTDKERPLHKAQPGDHLSTVARARTLTVLGRLDDSRKKSILKFLYEAALLGAHNKRAQAIASLEDAELNDTELGDSLWELNLHGADFSGAK